MNIFNNREIAIIIWLLLFFIFALTKKDVRKTSLNLLKSIIHPKMLLIIFMMIAYNCLVIYILFLIKFWDILLLKESILWFLFTGFQMVMNSGTSNKKENIFKDNIIKNIKIVMIIEFIANIYTFPLYVELILIPILIFIGAGTAIAEFDKKYLPAAKFLNSILLIISIFIIGNAIYNIIIDFKNFGSTKTLKEFLLPPILTISFLPFIYYFVLFISYETLFIRLCLSHKNDIELVKYIKRNVYKFCKLSLRKVNQVSNIDNYNFLNIESKKDVDEMIKVHMGIT